MKEIYFGDFRIYVLEHIRDVEQQGVEPYSVEWFLLRYLRRVASSALPPTTPGRMDNAMRALIRFYVDMIEEQTELGDRCIKINKAYRKTLRISQETR